MRVRFNIPYTACKASAILQAYNWNVYIKNMFYIIYKKIIQKWKTNLCDQTYARIYVHIHG